ncbi:MAG: hypothetical protein U0359_00350 [Byssovorax sp.]
MTANSMPTEPTHTTGHHQVLPSVQDLCINVPLYETFEIDEADWEQLANLKFYRGHIDAFCIDCGQDAVFRSTNTYSSNVPKDVLKDSIFGVPFSCARNSKHELFFLFRVHKQVLSKIGQHPSLADLSHVHLRKYRSALDKSTYSELARAVGLAAHGVGIGAFVYLRRIFERLIEEARCRASSMPGWDADEFAKCRVDEKISMLRHELPEALVTNRSLYAILSKGVHELGEEDCLAAFPVVRLGIELILDSKLEEAERKRKLREAEKAISRLREKL